MLADIEAPLTQPQTVNARPVPAQSLLGPEKLKLLYTAMLRLRLLSDRKHSGGRNRGQSPRMQEASIVGSTIDLGSHDIVVAPIGELFAGLIDATSARAVADSPGQMQAVTTQQPRESVATLLQHANAAERIALAAGAAFGGNGSTPSRVVVVFSDDEGLLEAHESLQLALAHRLPVICVQQASQTKKNRRRTGRKESHKILTIPVDQSDVLAVYRVASESIDKARRGVGPTIIQCVQPSREVKDPIEFLEMHLRKKNLWSDELKREVEEAVGLRLSRPTSEMSSPKRR